MKIGCSNASSNQTQFKCVRSNLFLGPPFPSFGDKRSLNSTGFQYISREHLFANITNVFYERMNERPLQHQKKFTNEWTNGCTPGILTHYFIRLDHKHYNDYDFALNKLCKVSALTVSKIICTQLSYSRSYKIIIHQCSASRVHFVAL